MEDREEVSPSSPIGPMEPARMKTFGALAAERRRALERIAKWRITEDTSIWPPPPKRIVEPLRSRPRRKSGNGVLAVFGVMLVSFWAFFIGLAAGIGHKDFSELLISNIEVALFDICLWGLAIFYWFGVIKAEWQGLKSKRSPFRAMVFYVSVVVLIGLYGSGLVFSLICLTARAAASDTTF